jgi:putative transposase
LSDNGSNFCSNEFEDFLQSLKIEHRKSSIYYPQSNGLIERVHRTMKESIASLSDEVIEWSDRLLFFKLHYNNSKHVVTQYMPSEIFFGRNLNIPLESYDSPKYAENFSEYSKKIKEHLRETRDMISKNEKVYFDVQKKYTIKPQKSGTFRSLLFLVLMV